MQVIEQALISFFIRVAQKERALIEKLEQSPSFILTSQQWSFTLLSLFTFLQSNDDIFKPLNYKQFKQLIYHCPINQSVKTDHAEIIINDNQGNIDHSTYCLVWQAMK